MLSYVIRRVSLIVPSLLVISFITFSLGFYGPGDPVRVLMGENWNDEETYQVLRHQYGLDRPFLVQYLDYVSKIPQFDFGRSILRRMPVRDMLGSAFVVTAQLGVLAVFLLAILGIGLGVLAALRQNTWLDYIIVSGGIVLHSIPVFVLAPGLMILFVINLKLMDTPSGWDGIVSPKVILPVLLLTAGPLIVVIRQTRASVLDILSNDYVRTARAKGLPQRLVIVRHILKNALIPVLTTLGVVANFILIGSVFIESIFSIPGFGQTFFSALKARDYPVLMGTTLLSALVILLVNLLVDLAYVWLDPRVQLE